MTIFIIGLLIVAVGFAAIAWKSRAALISAVKGEITKIEQEAASLGPEVKAELQYIVVRLKALF